MKKYIFIAALFFSFNSYASTPLVNAKWLSENLDDKELVLLDIRSKAHFDYVRIPRSVHSDYSQWRQPKTKILRKMIPSKEHLNKLLSDVGINKSSHIVIISGGETVSDLAAASRVYWTLEQIGHEKKSILNGGIISWAQHRLPLTQAKVEVAQKSNYVIEKINDQLDSGDVLNAINNQANLIDTRSMAEHNGIILSAADERRGTIKTSKPLPYDWFSNNKSGTLLNTQSLRNIVTSIDLKPDQETIVYCHTGHRAALSWFVLHELLENKNTKLYDGSTRDWATQDHLPMTREIKIEL